MKTVLLIPGWNDPYQKNLLHALKEVGIEARLGSKRILRDLFFVSVAHRRLQYKRCHVVHLHWQHPFLLGRSTTRTLARSLRFLAILLIARAVRVRIVWTVHNIVEHEQRHPRLELAFCRVISKIAHVIIVHCSAAGAEVRKHYGDALQRKLRIIPHGPLHVRQERLRDRARQVLGLQASQRVILSLGLIREYKGLRSLVQAFRTLDSDNLRLLIAGAPRDPVLFAFLEASAAEDPRISLFPGFVSEEMLTTFYDAADVAAFPYQAILSSGGAFTAMGHAKPLVFPRIGCMPELLSERANFLFDVGSLSSLRGALVRAINCSEEELQLRGLDNLASASSVTWQSIALETVRAYVAK